MRSHSGNKLAVTSAPESESRSPFVDEAYYPSIARVIDGPSPLVLALFVVCVPLVAEFVLLSLFYWLIVELSYEVIEFFDPLSQESLVLVFFDEKTYPIVLNKAS